MSSRVGGAALAFLAALLLIGSLATSAWWSGPIKLQGRVIESKTVSIGLLGAQGCNTKGDGKCKDLSEGPSPIFGGTFQTLGLATFIATALLTLELLGLGVVLLRGGPGRRLVAIAAIATGTLAMVIAIAFVLARPDKADVPLGLGLGAFGVGLVAGVARAALSLRPEAARAPAFGVVIAAPAAPFATPGQLPPSSPPAWTPSLAIQTHLPTSAPPPDELHPHDHTNALFAKAEPPPPFVGMPVVAPFASAPSPPQSAPPPPTPPPRPIAATAPPPRPTAPTAPPPPRPIAPTAPPPPRPTGASGPSASIPTALPPRPASSTAPPPTAIPLPPLFGGAPASRPSPTTPPANAGGARPTAPTAPEEPDHTHTGVTPAAPTGDDATSPAVSLDRLAPPADDDTQTVAQEKVSPEDLDEPAAVDPPAIERSGPRPKITGPIAHAQTQQLDLSTLSGVKRQAALTPFLDPRDHDASEPTEGVAEPPRPSRPRVSAITSTASPSLAPPAADAFAAGGPSPACPQCEAPMIWVDAHLRFYCKPCRMYF
jgi:hypothetical protein